MSRSDSRTLTRRLRIAGVQANTWLIQNIHRTNQCRTERGSQLNALVLPSRQGVGQAVERQVA